MLQIVLRRPLLTLSLALLAACGPEDDLVVYTSVDQVHSEIMMARFEEETGLRVRVEYDIEASKTVGLVARLRTEAERSPRCDVFWNNEIGHTIALARDGLLSSYDSPSAADIPSTYRDPENRWTGFAARGRIVIRNTELTDYDSIRLADLLDDGHPKAAIVKPLTGTTLTHFAVLGVNWGDERLDELCSALVARNAGDREGTQLALYPGNGNLAKAVASGASAWGFTDTDDFNVQLERGESVALLVPDQGPDDDGMLLIPNTVAILEQAPHRAAAEQFVDWLLRPETEALIAASDSANIPVRADVERPEHVLDTAGLKLMEVDWNEVGRRLPEIQTRLKEAFLR